MPRHAVYLLLTNGGPTKDQQLALIRKRVTLGKQDEIYTDDLTVRYRRKDAALEDRAVAIRQLRKGDVLVVATPGCLGVGRDDIRSALHELARKGAPLLDASSGKSVLWSEEVADAVEFLDRAVLERRRKAAETAREVKAALGHVYIPEEKPLAVSDAHARQMWFDRVKYPSQQKIAELCGVSYRTLYNRFGPRSGVKALKRKSRK